MEEENLFPPEITEAIEKTVTLTLTQSKIKESEEYRAKKRYGNLVKERNEYKKPKLQNKSLGPKHRVLGTHRDSFKELVEIIQDKTIDSFITDLKPQELRRIVVRLLWTTEGREGDELRKIWV